MARNKYDVDEVLEDKFDLNQLKRLLAYLIPYRKRFVSVGFMMLSASAFTMLIPQFFQKVMDVCIPNKDMKGIAFYSFLTLLAAFYSAFSLRYKIKYTNQIGQQIIHDMRYDIFEHLQAYYDKMLEEYPQLLAQNVNAWFQREPSVRMIRTIEGTARAFLSNRYRRIDNLDIASIVLPVLQDMEGMHFESCQLTESRIRRIWNVTWVSPG